MLISVRSHIKKYAEHFVQNVKEHLYRSEKGLEANEYAQKIKMVSHVNL